MNELTDLIFPEKYRPKKFDDLVFNEKATLIELVRNPLQLPSLIFYSSKPGTGKTSTAKLLISELSCDSLSINSSEERGIDVIRDKINMFVRGMSSNSAVKRCVFLDEADGLTKQAQDSLKNLMETYSDNCFFILSCNDFSKIIEPIRSRCRAFNFNKPDKQQIIEKLWIIIEQEKIDLTDEDVVYLCDSRYPDIRMMILDLQAMKTQITPVSDKLRGFVEAVNKLKNKDVEYFKQAIYSQELDLQGFNKHLFSYVLNNHKIIGIEKAGKIALLLADNEKSWQQGVNFEIVFFANLLEIMRII